MPPLREFFLNDACNLVRFGVYLDQIFSLKKFQNYHFLYKKILKISFLIEKFFFDTCLL